MHLLINTFYIVAKHGKTFRKTTYIELNLFIIGYNMVCRLPKCLVGQPLHTSKILDRFARGLQNHPYFPEKIYSS